MGKDLKGKELGLGIGQRKDGLYTARFTDNNGIRKQKYFKKLQECRNWLADAKYEDAHGNLFRCDFPTVDAWYRYWIDSIKGGNIRYNTRKHYNNRYSKNIKPFIGNMVLQDVKPLHCQNILNQMINSYANTSIQQTRTVMFIMFESAVENEILLKNPVTGAVKCKAGRESKDKRVLTLGEQALFLQAAKGENYYNQYAFLLQTGLRVGEMMALKWCDIDFEERNIHVCRNMVYVESQGVWKTGLTKSKAGERKIPLTNEAVRILRNQREKLASQKIIAMEYVDFVFLSQKGMPIRRAVYNTDLLRLADKAGVKRFSMHTLRHTFATRCIEAGMKPKVLQTILGHANIGMTLNLYVHVTEEEQKKEFSAIENALKVI